MLPLLSPDSTPDPPVMPMRKFHKTEITVEPLSPLPGSPGCSQPARPQVPVLRLCHKCRTSAGVQVPGEDCARGSFLLPTSEGRGLTHTQAWGRIPTVGFWAV